MVIGLLTLELHIPQARSLKDKRRAVRSLEARLRQRFNVSVAEVGYQDLRQRCELAVVAVNTDHDHLMGTLDSAAAEAERSRELQVIHVGHEVL